MIESQQSTTYNWMLGGLKPDQPDAVSGVQVRIFISCGNVCGLETVRFLKLTTPNLTAGRFLIYYSAYLKIVS